MAKQNPQAETAQPPLEPDAWQSLDIAGDGQAELPPPELAAQLDKLAADLRKTRFALIFAAALGGVAGRTGRPGLLALVVAEAAELAEQGFAYCENRERPPQS